MEIGKTGLAYRKCDKYRLKDQVRCALNLKNLQKRYINFVGIISRQGNT
jgi:hypothetical protein